MLKKISDILFTKWGVYFVTFFVHLLTVPLYNVPLITDELDPLALGFMLRGDNWSDYLIADGVYYKYGQLLFYLPFIVLIRNNTVLYKVLLIINALMVSTIPVCILTILEKHLRSSDHKINCQIALLVGWLPTVLLNSKLIWAESLLMALQWIIILILAEVIDKEISPLKSWIYSVLLAVLQVYAYMVHTRGLIICLATILCVLVLKVLFRVKNIRLFPYCAITVIMWFIDSFLANGIKNILYKGADNLAGGSTEFLNRDLFKNIFSMPGMKTWGEEIIGWLFSSVCSTLGLGGLGLIIMITIAVNYHKWNTFTKKELMLLTFGLLFWGGSLATSIFFFNDLFARAGMEIIRRGDKIIYTRYMEPANVCIVFVGLYFLLVKELTWIKKGVIYAALAFIFLHGFFISNIAERINGSIVWASSLMTVDYLCDLSCSTRGGTYSSINNLSGGIACFSLLGICVFIWGVKNYKKKGSFLTVFTVCFLICYLRNAYNVLYREDNYVMNVINSFESIVESVEDDQYKNIYLDDEIIRYGFQYYFSDYYILTKRDENRFQVDEMFIISPQQTYNLDLFNDDFYEVVGYEDLDNDYHIYIKGNALCRKLNQYGYATRKIMKAEMES